MLEYLDWDDAAALVREGIGRAITDGVVTYDLARQRKGATKVSCSAFGQAIIERM